MTTKQVSATVSLVRCLEANLPNLAPDLKSGADACRQDFLAELSRYYQREYNCAGPKLHEGVDLPGACLILAFALDPFIHKLSDLINVAGLSGGLDKAQARGLLESTMKAKKTKITPEALRYISSITDQSLASLTRRLRHPSAEGYDFEEVLEAITRRRYDQLLHKTLANSEFHLMDQYDPIFREQLNREHAINDSKEYKLLAEQLVNQRGRPEDSAAYKRGFLPQTYLEQRAKRVVLREVLRDLWNCLREQERKETA